MVIKKLAKKISDKLPKKRGLETYEPKQEQVAEFKKSLEPEDPLGLEQEKYKSLEEEVLKFLKREFSVLDSPEKLIPSTGPIVSPTCVFRYGDESWCMWYRMPIKGETGITYIPDFVVFKGQHRMSPREKNPDLIIECRELPGGMSNRTDPRVVKEMIGVALDTLPGKLILVTNRLLADYAKVMARDYGIGIVEVDAAKDPQTDLMALIIDDAVPSRAKLLDQMEKATYKLNNLFRMRKRQTGVQLGSDGKAIPTGSLKSKIWKVLEDRHTASAMQLSSTLQVHEDFILNELNVLKREKRVEISRPSNRSNGYKYDEWAVLR